MSVAVPIRFRAKLRSPSVKISSPIMTTVISRISSRRQRTRTLSFSAPVSGSADW